MADDVDYRSPQEENVRKRTKSFHFKLSAHGLCERLLKTPKYFKDTKRYIKLSQALHKLERLVSVKKKKDIMREFGFLLTHEFTNMLTKIDIEIPTRTNYHPKFYTSRTHYEHDILRNKRGVMKCIKLESEIQDFEQMNGIGDNMDYRYRSVHYEAQDIMFYYQVLKRIQRPKQHLAFLSKEKRKKTFDTLYFRYLISQKNQFINLLSAEK